MGKAVLGSGCKVIGWHHRSSLRFETRVVDAFVTPLIALGARAQSLSGHLG